MQDLFHNITTDNLLNLRIPYQGSKNSITEKLIYKMLEVKPKAKYFIDLFGGGGSMSFTALQIGLNVVYNEIDTGIFNLVSYIIERVKNKEKGHYGLFPDEWYNFVDKEKFDKIKNRQDAYSVAMSLCYSFSNGRGSYAYGKHRNEQVKLTHDFIMFQCQKACKELSRLKQFTFKVSNKESWNERRLESLQSLESLERLERFVLFNLSYEKVNIDYLDEEMIIYCDPPYRNTAKYKVGNFNHKTFDDWFRKLPYTAFLSEYSSPFKCIYQIPKKKLMCGAGGGVVLEKLFINR